MLFHSLILKRTPHLLSVSKSILSERIFSHADLTSEFWQGPNQLKMRAFQRTSQAALIIRSATNSTYNTGNSACSVLYKCLVKQQAMKISMMEGMDKAGPVIWHNKGFDLVQTSLPHFSPAKLSNLFEMKSESQKCHPRDSKTSTAPSNKELCHSEINESLWA